MSAFDEHVRLAYARSRRECSPRELAVLRGRYGLDGCPRVSLSKLAAELDVSRQRVAVLEQKALAALGLRRPASQARADRVRHAEPHRRHIGETMEKLSIAFTAKNLKWIKRRARELGGVSLSEVFRRVLDDAEERETRRAERQGARP